LSGFTAYGGRKILVIIFSQNSAQKYHTLCTFTKYNLIIALDTKNLAQKMVATVGRCYINPQDYAQENYYSQGDGLANSEWLGKAASAQGLNGQIQENHFQNAYKALDPNGNPLRKQQSYSKQSQRHNRPGTDVTLSAPKSISVAALVMGDRSLEEAHKNAVRATIKYIEKNCIFYQTKQNGKKLLLQSQTAQIAVFHHDDNRNKDPQLHSHCVILNQTKCPDGTWRAVANKELYIQQKTIGAYYAHELARQLKQIGREIEWTDDHTFELAGVDKEKLNAIFSTRSNQIESELAMAGLTRSGATAAQKQAACLKTRPQKKHHLHPTDRERQLEEWRQRATDAGIEIPLSTRFRVERTENQQNQPAPIPLIIQSATDILTERQTAFTKHEFLKECLRQSQGKYDPKHIQASIDSASDLVPTRDGRLTTTHQLRREQKILQLASSGQNSFSPLASREQATEIAIAKNLNSGQTNALHHMATSRDAIVLVQGDAGVGKTYTMKALKETIGDLPIRGLAPSAVAAEVLQKESDISSQTLASYLLVGNERLPKNELLLVDEAGMLSTSQMEQLLEKAFSTNSRVILVGDTKQLSAVSSGAPFKLLQDLGFPTVTIDQNLRTSDPFLKQVVERMATHELDEESVNCAYQKLNDQGKIQQIVNESERIDAIALDYLSRQKEVRSKTLILAGTNADSQAITTAVRSRLIAEGTLGNESLKIPTLRRKDLDKFAITQSHHYQRGDVIKFQTENAQFSKDFYYRVSAVNPKEKSLTLVDTAGVDYTLPLDKYKQREVYLVKELEIRPGEQMRFTKNLRTPDLKQLNGQRFTISGFTSDGQIQLLTNGKTSLVSSSGLFHSDYRYVDTVHSSQGQTADYCIYSASPVNSLTIGRESFYVAASRAKSEFVVYTASAQDLGVTIQKSRANENALDLVPSSLHKKEKHLLERAFLEASERREPEQFAQPSLSTSAQEEPVLLEVQDNPLSRLSDAELLKLVRTVNQWQKTCPPEPSVELGKSYRERIDSLERQKAKLEKQLRIERKKLEQLGQPRSFFNPFGVKAEIIEAQQDSILKTQIALSNIQVELNRAETDFKYWKRQAKVYLAWHENPHTKKMSELADFLNSPPIQKRLQDLELGYAIHEAASYILESKGTPTSEGRELIGNVYRISQSGDTLTIYHKKRPSPIYQATKREGILSLDQFDMSETDKQIIEGVAQYLQPKQEQKLERGPQLGR
jgi:conjugative relaxase-like TrwC/TraI family protein